MKVYNSCCGRAAHTPGGTRGSAGPALSTPPGHDPPALMEPLRASRRRPFFFRMKLPPMKMLELMARPRPMQKSYFPRPGLMACE